MTENERLYTERERRFNDIVALRKPDRIPVIPQVVHYFPTRIKGMSNKDAGYDNALRYRCMKEAVLEFGWDWAVPNGMFPSETFDAVALKQIRWPGGDLPDDSPFQFVENEWLAEDEYDAFLADPNGFTLTQMLPRIAGNLAGLGQIPLPPLYWFSNAYNLISIAGNVLAAPPMRTALESLLQLADATARNNAALGAYIGGMAALGYPFVWAVATVPPFDMVFGFPQRPARRQHGHLPKRRPSCLPLSNSWNRCPSPPRSARPRCPAIRASSSRCTGGPTTS